MKTNKIYDLTLPLSDSLTKWPGHPEFKLTNAWHLSRGDHATVSNLFIGAHMGTHVDAPAHFIDGGKLIDTLDLNLLIGEVLVVDIRGADAISSEVLETASIPVDTKRILFRKKTLTVGTGTKRSLQRNMWASQKPARNGSLTTG